MLGNCEPVGGDDASPLGSSTHAASVASPPPLSDPEEHRKGRKEKESSRWRSLKRQLCGISMCLTIPLAILFIIIAVVLSCVFSALTDGPRVTLTDVHRVHAATLMSELSLYETRIYQLAVSFAIMAPSHVTSSDSIIPNLCSLLDNLDPGGTICAMSLYYVDEGNLFICSHADTAAPSMRSLFGVRSTNGNATAAFYINQSTYNFVSPKKVWRKILPGRQNMTEVLSPLRDSPIFDEYYNFVEGLVDKYPMEAFWQHLSSRPNILTYTLPLTHYREEDLDGVTYNRTRGKRAVEVRCQGGSTLKDRIFDGSSGLRVILLEPDSLNSSDPIVLYNNWGQALTNDTRSYNSLFDYGITVMYVSNITDPTVKAALNHIDLRLLQKERRPVTRSFSYKSSPALVSIWRDVGEHGMTSVAIVVTPLNVQTGPYLLRINASVAVFSIVTAAYTIFFWCVTKRMLAWPLQRVKKGLLKAATLDRSSREQISDSGCLSLSEVAQVMDTYAVAMKLLRQADSFIPEHARRILEAQRQAAAATEDTEAMLYEMDEIDADTATTTATNTGQLIHRTVTAVFVTPRAAPLAAAQSHAVGLSFSHAATREAAMAAAATAQRVERQVSVGGSEPPRQDTGVAAFATREAVETFLRLLLSLAEHFGGTVAHMDPEQCVVYFQPRRRPNKKQEPLLAVVREQAIAAVHFALALSHELEKRRSAAHLPLVYMFLDTTNHRCGLINSPFLQQSLYMHHSDRDVDRDLGHVVPMIGLDVAMTGETALLVRHCTRQLPCEVIVVESYHRSKHYQVTLYEALHGSVACDPWKQFRDTFNRAFKEMTRGNYVSALQYFHTIHHIDNIHFGAFEKGSSATGPTGTPTIGNLPQEDCLERTEWVSSVQVERLSKVCAARVMAGDTRPYIRRRDSPPTTVKPKLSKRLSTLQQGMSRATSSISHQGTDAQDEQLYTRYLEREEVEAMVGRGAAYADKGMMVHTDESKKPKPLTIRVSVPDMPQPVRTKSKLTTRKMHASSSKSSYVSQLHDPRNATSCVEIVSATASALAHSNSAAHGQLSTTGVDGGSTIASRDRYICRIGVGGELAVISHSETIMDNKGITWTTSAHSECFLVPSSICCPCLGPAGTLSFAYFYAFSNKVNVPTGSKHNTVVTDAMHILIREKTKEQLEAGKHLFVDAPVCEYLMNLLGFSNDEEGGVVEILEYYPGGTLREMMDRYTCVLPIPTVTHYIASVLLALHYLHGRGIVHGDVRPENVHVSTEAHCKLRGFFANRVLAQRILLLHESCYVCPKVAGGAAATTASDVYSAGLVLLEMLRGAPPWKWAAGTQGRTVGDLQELLDDSHAFRAALASGAVVVAADAADIPRDPGPLLRDLLDRCLHSDPKQRTTAEEAVCLIKKAEGGE